MDPNQTLRELRRKASENVALGRPAYDLTQDFQDLDEWLSTARGFLPEAWDHAPYAQLRAATHARELREALNVAYAAADGDSNDAEIEAWQNVGSIIDPLGPPDPAGVEMPGA